MTEHHQDLNHPAPGVDAPTAPSQAAPAPTAPAPAEHSTAPIGSDPRADDTSSIETAARKTAAIEQPTQPGPVGPLTVNGAGLDRPTQPIGLVRAAPRTDDGAGLTSPTPPTQRVTVAQGTADGAGSATPTRPTEPVSSPAHPGGTAGFARPSQPTPSSRDLQRQPTTTSAGLGGSPRPAATPGLGPLDGWEQPGNSETKATTTTRTRWTPLVGTAAAAALLASFATAGLTGAFGADTAPSSPAASSIATIGQTSSDTVPVAGSSADDPDWEKVAASVAASVVAIQVSTGAGGGEGSGVIIDDAGHIVTNNHVVSGAENDTVQVTLNDGRLYEATVVGTDPSTDLAIVQINDAPDDLSPAALGDSDDVVVGAPVMAVGNPLGLANTVTTGIVSAVDRPVSASSSEAASASDVVVTNAIQIDAAINPGNSGGPLFDAQGRVVGITSSIATLSSGGSQSGSIGLGFAIPVNLARDVAQQLIEDGTAEHAFLGVSLSDGTATADEVSRRGAVVEQVTDGSPAASAEIQVGDVIVAIDGEPVSGSEALTAYVRERSAGDTAELTIVRDGEALDVTVTLATRETAVSAQAPSGSSDSGTEQGRLPGFPGSGVSPDNPFGSQG